ncbi:uncharacterized protein DNG_03467 [Cephalotrichum gorgonifer]|uniref:Small acidic protein n=1 Tax=Cephalotrichum gorgonifer TaxID=2041049 RepID=A0AAE8STN9_9PEZI|nr:uncharacterized protein DNG_03467 [Cephalotrichum gorgonifer]
MSKSKTKAGASDAQNTLEERNRALDRVEWLRTLAKRFLHEAKHSDAQVSNDGEQTLDRVAWLKSLAKRFLVEADELEAKWSSEDVVMKGSEGETKSAGGKKRKIQSASKITVDIPAKVEDKTKTSKSKDGKGKSTTRDSSTANVTHKDNAPSSANLADRWNVTALEGGSDRQNKFMKLLGGGKVAASASSAPPNAGRPASKLDIHRVQDDLQRQYDAGMRMKFEGQGQRRGLGG